MKYFLLILIGFTTSFLFDNYAYGLWIPLSPEELIEQSETIFVGTVTAITPVEVEYQSQIARDGTVKDSVGPEVITLEEYTVDVEEYLKDSKDSDTMKVLRATVSGVPSGPAKISGFEIGDRVLFYLPKDERQTHFSGQYLPESFKIPKQCNAKSVLEQPRIIGANDFRIMQEGIEMDTNFTANKSIQFIFNKDMRTLDGASFNVTVTISKTNEDKTSDVVLSKTIHAESKPCEWIASAELEFVPTAGEYYRTIQITQGTSEEGYAGPFLVVEDSSASDIIPPPLKQMKLGIKLGHIICDKDKHQTWNVHFKPACVFPDSETKLLERGWAKLRLMLPDSGDPALEMKLTGNNEMSYRLTGSLKVGDEGPLNEDQKREIVWKYAQKYYPRKQFLEYSITPNQYHYHLGEKIQFDLLEWGKYYGCWDLKLRIFDRYNEVFHEEILRQYCIEPAGGSPETGIFNSYSIGRDIKELVCEKPGYYMIEVSNDKIFPPTILQNFACLENEN